VRALVAFRRAWRRLRGRWLRGLGLIAFWAAAGGVAWGLLIAAAWGQRTPSGGAVAVNLLLLLAALTARSAARVGAWGSILALFDASPVPAPRDWRPVALREPVIAAPAVLPPATEIEPLPVPVPAQPEPPSVEPEPAPEEPSPPSVV
jgi:hypothetical protein